MKRLLISIPLLLTLVLTEHLSAQYYDSPQVRVHAYGGFGHVGFFYRPLLPYGEWLELDAGFYAWRPHRVPYGWHPYRHGHWVWSNHGWYWISHEPFGWAVYHYGRWFYDDYYGWIWIPDDVWGPGWVEWRYDDDYIGWAPLPPYAGFHIGIGIHYTMTWDAPYTYWCFVRHHHFTKTNYSHYSVGSSATRRLIRTTRSAGRYEMDRGTVFNHGIDRSFIEKQGRVRIDPYEVTRSGSTRENVVRSGGVRRIESYRPEPLPERAGEERIDARKATRTPTLQMDRVDRTRPQEPSVREREGQRERTPSRMDQQPPRSTTSDPTRKEPAKPTDTRTKTREGQKPPTKDQSAVIAPPSVREPSQSRSAPPATVTQRPATRETAASAQKVERSSKAGGRSTPPLPATERKKQR